MKESGTMYGYCRVSTVLQNEARQVEAMRRLGVEEGNIIVEKASGKNFDRPRYRQLADTLQRGDLLVLSSLDRLGRNYEEIRGQWQYLVKDRGVDIVVLDMPILDTRRDNDITGHLISDIVLGLLSYVAHRERESILLRQAEGIACARQRGVRFGRRPIEIPECFEEVNKLCSDGVISSSEAARRLGVSRQTFQRWRNGEMPRSNMCV